MIDWSGFDKDSPFAWTTLADQLIARAQFAVSSAPFDQAAIEAASDDFREFTSKVTLSCPVEAIEAIRRASSQLAESVVAAAIADLATRSARLDAVSARLSSASNELKAKAAQLRLEPARRALAHAQILLSKAEELRKNAPNLTKNDTADELGRLIRLIKSIIKDLDNTA